MGKHIQPRIENDLLRFAVNISEEAKIEIKKIGNMRGSRKVVTIKDKSYLYDPNKLSKVLLAKLNKLSKANKFKEADEFKRIY